MDPGNSCYDSESMAPLIRSTTSEGVSAETQLHDLGYEQELPRTLSMMSILGLSFAIMGVPLGLSTTMYIGLTDGQYVAIFWGWCIVSVISLCIATSLAEICSVYPTSGGVYYWAAMLSKPKWAPLASWTTGWLTLVGNWTVTTSICFSGAQLALSSVALWDEGWAPSALQTVLAFWAVMAVCAAVNFFMSRHLDVINAVCIYWTVATVVIILVALVACADHTNSAKTVFTHYDPSASGWGPGWAFLIGLLQAAYTLTGYGMVASMCEEVQNPEREVPKGMILSVAAAGVTGIIFLLPVLFTLPLDKIKYLLDAPGGMPMGLLFKLVTGSAAGGFALLLLLLGILFFAGVGALTAASRCTYAFARDGAIPGSGYWKVVNHKYETPAGGLALSTAVCCLLGLIYFGSTAAFNAFTGVATICLSASYGLPVFVSLLERRAALQHAPLKLGPALGYTVNIVTVLWIALATLLFCMPVSIPVTRETMNYASAVFMAFFVVSAAWYVAWGRKHFYGPPEIAHALHPADKYGDDEQDLGYGSAAGHARVGPMDILKAGDADENIFVVEGYSVAQESTLGSSISKKALDK